MSRPSSTAGRPPALGGVGINITGLSHRWGTTTALADIATTIHPGSFVAIVGASGCGKSTLLRLLAGLESPSRGTITIDGSSPDEVRRQRRIGWVAQRPALMPWLTVRGNIELATSIHADAPPGHSAAELVHLVGLDGFGDALPATLSGGMQQRAALARTLALGAPVWLMDEPFAALDELTREALADDLVAIWQRLRPTVVWVTHHLGEAVALADRVLVLSPRPGRIVADIAVDLPRPRDVTAPASQDIVRDARAMLTQANHDPHAVGGRIPRPHDDRADQGGDVDVESAGHAGRHPIPGAWT